MACGVVGVFVFFFFIFYFFGGGMAVVSGEVAGEVVGGVHGVVLFAHGSSRASWRVPFDVMAEAVRVRAPGVRVAVAFLELMEPSLVEVLRGWARSGVVSVRVVPVFFGVGVHVASDLRALVEEVCLEFPELSVVVAEAVGECVAVREAIVNFALG